MSKDGQPITDSFAIKEVIEKMNRQNRKIHTPFQEALKLYMSIRGVTARGLGASLGVDHTAISRFVNGADLSNENYAKLLSWFITKPNYPPSIDESGVGAEQHKEEASE